VDIFEVFRIGSGERHGLEALGLPVVQKRFTELTAITSLEQLNSASALATLPAPGHVVVDKDRFREMFKKEAEEASAKKTSGLLNKAEKAIEELKTEFENNLKNLLDVFTTSLKEQNSVANTSVMDLLSKENLGREDTQKSIDIIFETQRQNVTAAVSGYLMSRNQQQQQQQQPQPQQPQQ